MVDSAVARPSEAAPPRRPRRRPGENRERLILSGLECFGDYGFFGASTAEIARRAEVPQPHVYANFATKQALFIACVKRACELLTAAVPDGGAAASLTHGAAARLVLQAIANVQALERQDSGAANACRELIEPLRTQLGTRSFSRLLEQATVTLINQSDSNRA